MLNPQGCGWVAYAPNEPEDKTGTDRQLERRAFACAWASKRTEEFVMDYKKVGIGLGYFSIGLGLLELAAPGRLARWLGVDGNTAKTVIALFGARELLAGGALLRGPAVSTNVWNRVIGDSLDLAALGLAFARSNRRPAVAGALGFVAGATLLDAMTARGLDRETARTWPRAERQPA
jgi:hypothetical protein